MINLSILDYFGLFSFGFRLSVHLDLTSKSGYQKLLKDLFICALWSPAGKGLTSWLSFVVSSVSFSLSHWYPGSGVLLDCIDS